MKRTCFLRLYAWLTSPFRTSRDGMSNRRRAAERSASPFLVFVAIILFLILAIIEFDRYRDALRAIGIIFNEDGVWPISP